MDIPHDQGSHIPSRGTIPRLSKLPMPRSVASTDNLKLSSRSSATPTIHHDDLRKTSQLPRPLGPTTPLGENMNQSIRSRYGWTERPANPRSQSPVRDALRDVHTLAMETTPPGLDSGAPVFEAGNENPTTGIKDVHQISPSPSPTALRPDSPTKRPFRPPGRTSPTREVTTLPPVVSPGEIYTPPKAFVKGQRSRIAKPLRESRRAVSSMYDLQAKDAGGMPPAKHSAQTVRVKPSYGDRTVLSPTLTSKPSLSSIFREPSSVDKPSSTLSLPGVESHPALLKPRSRGENTLAPSTPPKSTATAKSNGATQRETTSAAAKDSQPKSSPRSSAALRETIAKARATKKKTRESTGAVNMESPETSTWPPTLVEEELLVTGDGKGLLRKRIQQAVTSGYLNISAMNLKQIPSDVLKMYDPENSTTNWSEMVDLTKMNAADNELEDLGDDILPDLADIGEDDERNTPLLGLEVLDLHRNHFQRLPLSFRTLTRLQTLNLSGNKLGNAAFEVIGQIPHLKELFMADNLLEGTLDFAKYGADQSSTFAQLETLDLHGNSLHRFGESGLSEFKSLRVLNIAGNKFSSLDWQKLPTSTITELNVSRNRFAGVLVTGCEDLEGLRVLDAAYNELEKITDDEMTMPNLRSLVSTGNKMASLGWVTRSEQLITLEVADNRLEEIPSDLSRLGDLKTADFSNNNIRIVPAEIATMSNLSILKLAGNPLREKKYLSMSTAELKLDLERKLEGTGTGNDHSDTATLPSSTSATQYLYAPSDGVLDLSSQSLADISTSEIDLSTQIHTLKLSNNDLSVFPVSLLTHPSVKYSLQSLDLSHNPQLHPTNYLTSELFLPNLKSLYVVSTGLTSLDTLTTHLRAPELKELNISCHRLAGHVPWVRAWWPKTTTLLATDNWFTSVDVEGVRGLEVLDIRNNEIEHLPPKLGLLGNVPGQREKQQGRLRVLEVNGNRFRVPRINVVEKGTEAVLKDLRRMVKDEEVTDEWRDVL